MTLRALDLFCGAGGATQGLQRAGFHVTGVDLRPQPRYCGDAFVQTDALDYVWEPGAFDLVWASPPCQGYSTQTADRTAHPRLIAMVRQHVASALDTPYVIENVEGARRELYRPIRLCGSSFGRDLRRHRYFECSFPVDAPPCDHTWQTPRFRSLDQSMVTAGKFASVVGVHGHLNYPGEFALRCAAMGITWMTNEELVEAIPPVYAEHIALQFLLQRAAA